jgi:acetyltransferase
MWRYSDTLHGLYETPALEAELAPDRARAGALLRAARDEGRTLLSEAESKSLLACYGIATVETHVATNEDEATAIAERIGFPVVVKLHSRTITHKTEVSGVRLSIGDAEGVRRAFREIRDAVELFAGLRAFEGVTVQPMVRAGGYELIVGSTVDPQFGPVILFGSGGQMVELYGDRALALPPLNATLARRMMEETKIFRALRGFRGLPPVDIDALALLVVRFSEMVVELPWLREVDINPLIASERLLLALDARVVLHDPATDPASLPRPALRPYPLEYVSRVKLRDGAEVTFRPIRPEDEPLLIQFHGTLSERSVRLRYMQLLQLEQRVAHQRLIRVCFNDYDRDMALVVEHRGEAGKPEIVAVGRLVKTPASKEAEFALLVSDPWQGRGLGTELLQHLVGVARTEGIARIVGAILPENHEMQRICQKLGFRLRRPMDDPVVEAVLDLPENERAAA